MGSGVSDPGEEGEEEVPLVDFAVFDGSFPKPLDFFLEKRSARPAPLMRETPLFRGSTTLVSKSDPVVPLRGRATVEVEACVKGFDARGTFPLALGLG